MKTKKIAVIACLVALAMILSFVESQLPAFVAIPGIKIGLANIAVVFALYILGWRAALGISIVRVLLISMLFGNSLSLLYSVAGAALSFLGMVILKKSARFSCVGVSVCGGVLHNLGQILTALLVTKTAAIGYYLPFLLLSGTIAGVAIGIVSAIIIKRVPKRGFEV